MPLFRVENATASTGGVFLLPFPAVDWFSWAILGAVTEMVNRANWVGSSSEEIDYAVRESARMLASFQVLNFNPFPVGLLVPYGSSDVPDGFLLADGSEYATVDYPELFAVIGYVYGGSDDVFNVPRLVDRVVVGSGGDFSLGDSGGEQTHTLDVSEIPSHSHTIPATITTLAVEPGEISVLSPVPIISSNTGDTGGSLAHNNMQPYQSLTYLIYAGR